MNIFLCLICVFNELLMVIVMLVVFICCYVNMCLEIIVNMMEFVEWRLNGYFVKFDYLFESV